MTQVVLLPSKPIQSLQLLPDLPTQEAIDAVRFFLRCFFSLSETLSQKIADMLPHVPDE